MSEWIKVDKFGSIPEELGKSFLLCDEYGAIYVGSTIFDYNDAMYWAPMPIFPLPDPVITNDQWIINAINQGLI